MTSVQPQLQKVVLLERTWNGHIVGAQVPTVVLIWNDRHLAGYPCCISVSNSQELDFPIVSKHYGSCPEV